MQRCFGCRLVGGALLVAVALGSAAGFAADEPENIVKYRKTIMKANSGHIGALAAMAKGEVSFMDEAEMHATALHQMSQNLARLFPEGTGKGDTGEKSAALQAIWEQPDEFQQAVEQFQEQTAMMVEAAANGDQAAFAQQLGALGKQGCGNCHETFREEQN